MPSTPSTPKRARTVQQKQDRRSTILQAADAHLISVGVESFSMAELARASGVAKGTLYLYFTTREDVLLALLCDKLAQWESALAASVPARAIDRQFVAAYYHSAYADPGLLPLLSRLDSVIEHNVAPDTLIEAKRFMAALFARLARAQAPRLGLSVEQTFEVVSVLAPLLLGAAQVDAGPNLDRSAMPADVRRFIDAFASRDVFTTNACRILAAIRAGT